MIDYEISFNPRAAVPEFAQYEIKRRPSNLLAQSKLVAEEFAYGAHPRRRLDIYRAPKNPNGDVHVFFHGGYWRAGDKRNFSYLAKDLSDRGISTVISNYEFCGPSRFDDVVESALSAFSWILQNIGNHGGNPNRISISGHSAGAYLCAAILTNDWSQHPGTSLRGAMLVSGIYEPRKAIGTSVNQELKLTKEIASRFDLTTKRWQITSKAHIIVGSKEPAPWREMSESYFHRIGKNSSEGVRFTSLSECNHFSILDEYAFNGRLHETIVGFHISEN